MINRLLSLSLLVIFTVIIPTNAQNTRVHTKNTNTWFMYFGNHKFSERLGLHAEVQFRRSDVISDDQQFLIRTGLDYYLKDKGRLTVGYAFIQTYPYGDFAVPRAFPEHRIWEQFTTTQSLGSIKIAHRYRLEQRMIGNASTGEFKNGRFENRFRYMAKLTFNLSKGERPAYAALYDEIFVNFGKDVAYNIFDQNRAYGAIGFTLSKALKLELGYLLQTVQLRSLDSSNGVRNRIENNHTLQVGFFSTLPLMKASD